MVQTASVNRTPGNNHATHQLAASSWGASRVHSKSWVIQSYIDVACINNWQCSETVKT